MQNAPIQILHAINIKVKILTQKPSHRNPSLIKKTN